MTIGVFVSTFQPMLKNDGTINAAGTLEFYEPGQSGSTAKVVYSDYLLTTSIGSTITLDSNARKVIYLNGNYDLIEKDSTGATIVSRSNINPDQSTAITDINIISNGSFETSSSNIPSDWTLAEWNAGANVVDSSAGNFADGKYSMKFVSTGSGGGTLTTNSLFTVNENTSYTVDFLIKSSDAGVRNIVQFLWYDKDQIALGTPSTSIFDAAVATSGTTDGNSTSWVRKSKRATPPSGARFAKLKLIGCDSSDATSGTTWFDGVKVYNEDKIIKLVGGTIEHAEGTAVASAADCNIWGLADGNTVHITGTTAPSDWGAAPQAGASRWCTNDSALTLTYNATTNILPGDADIALPANSWFEVYAKSTSTYEVRQILFSDGRDLGLISSTAIPTTSGTEHNFTGIPSWVKHIMVMFNGISKSGTSLILIQIGSGSIQATGYTSASGRTNNANNTSIATATTGFNDTSDSAAFAMTGVIHLCHMGSNLWVAGGVLTDPAQTVSMTMGGSVTLSGALDRLRLTTVNGTDTFDAGSINILWE